MRAPYVLSLSPHSSIVIPAKAGIQNLGIGFPQLDCRWRTDVSRVRGNDDELMGND
jgi:hypothetical protein